MKYQIFVCLFKFSRLVAASLIFLALEATFCAVAGVVHRSLWGDLKMFINFNKRFTTFFICSTYVFYVGDASQKERRAASCVSSPTQISKKFFSTFIL